MSAFVEAKPENYPAHLQPEQQPEQQAVEKDSIAVRLSKKVRTVLRPDNSAKLAAAIGELRQLAARYKEIQTELDLQTSVAPFENRHKEAAAAYARSKNSGNLEKLIWSELLLERARDHLAPIRRAYYTSNGAFDIFKNRCSEWKIKLAAVAELRLSKAKSELSTITEQETQRLGSDYSADEVERSPLVGRAAGRVRHFETISDQIQSVNDMVAVDLWQRYAPVLLDD